MSLYEDPQHEIRLLAAVRLLNTSLTEEEAFDILNKAGLLHHRYKTDTMNTNLANATMYANKASSEKRWEDYSTAIKNLIKDNEELHKKIEELESRNPTYGWESVIEKTYRDVS